MILYVMTPEGDVLTADDLPPPNIDRWVIRHKAKVVTAVVGGLISLEEACKRYALSNEEFLEWRRAVDRYGVGGLRTTKLQTYRQRQRAVDAASPPK